MKTAVLTLAFMLIALSATAETLYVRPSAACANNGDGTAYGCAASPGATGAYRTFANVLTNASDETAGQVDPGDTLYVCGAHTTQFFYGAQDATTVGSGTAAARITISFNCPSDTGSIAPSSGNYAFVTYQNYLDIVNPQLIGGAVNTFALTTNSGGSTEERHVTVTGGNIGNNTVAGEKCVHLRGRHIVVTGVTVHDCYTDGIWATGKYIEVHTSSVSRISTGDTNGDCVQMSGEVDGSLMRGNTCDHTNVDSKNCYIATSTDSGFVEIDGNTCLKSVTEVLGLGIYVEAASYIHGNTVTGGVTGIQCSVGTGARCDVVGNLIQHANSNGVILGSTSTIAYVANNTIIGSEMAECLHTDVSAATVIMQNNILRDCPIGINKNNAANIDRYNIFYLVSEPVDVASVPTTPGTGSLLATNPLFLSATDFRLQSASPARRAGLSQGLCIDIRGRPCWTPPDMGAYQATAGDSASTRTTVATDDDGRSIRQSAEGGYILTEIGDKIILEADGGFILRQATNRLPRN